MTTPEDQEFLHSLGLSTAAPWFISSVQVFQDAYWYNQDLHRVGYGDIAEGQLERAAKQMEVGKALVILPPHVMTSNPSRSNKAHSNDVLSLRFVARNFAALVVPRCIYFPGDDGAYKADSKLGEQPTISPKATRHLLQSIQNMRN